MSILANNVEPDEMSHYTKMIFREKQFYLKIITSEHPIYKMDYSKYIFSNKKEVSINTIIVLNTDL